MRRALIVGIDDYPDAPLAGCVNDAIAIEQLLERNADDSLNFTCRVLTVANGNDAPITKPSLFEQINKLFEHECDVALFFFAGHGTENNLGGYLVTPDAGRYNEGVSMDEVLKLANQSKAREVVVILDCCHSGALGNLPAIDNSKSLLREGVSVLTASRSSQASVETHDGKGLFTSLVCDALAGGAADVVGNVTVASVYAYVDQVLGAWDQRPLLKSHVSKLIPLRVCAAGVSMEILRRLPKYFSTPDELFHLDPSYEPDAEPRGHENEKIFADLQKYRAARLLIPVDEDHLYFAAMRNKSCRLTELGQFYWRLANGGRI